MGKAIGGFLAALASIAAIVGLLVVLGLVHPFPSPPTLIVSPSSLKADTDCSSSVDKYVPVFAYYRCQVALSISGQGNLNWAASGGQEHGTQFTPQQGTLKPGQSVAVIITVGIVLVNSGQFKKTCPTTMNLIFTNETNPTNTVIVPWNC